MAPTIPMAPTGPSPLRLDRSESNRQSRPEDDREPGGGNGLDDSAQGARMAS